MAKRKSRKSAPRRSGKKYVGFKKLSSSLKRKGVKNPNALAASIGRKKYGKKRMAKFAKQGRKKG